MKNGLPACISVKELVTSFNRTVISLKLEQHRLDVSLGDYPGSSSEVIQDARRYQVHLTGVLDDPVHFDCIFALLSMKGVFLLSDVSGKDPIVTNDINIEQLRIYPDSFAEFKPVHVGSAKKLKSLFFV